MPPNFVPERFRSGIAAIETLDDAVFNGFVDWLGEQTTLFQLHEIDFGVDDPADQSSLHEIAIALFALIPESLKAEDEAQIVAEAIGEFPELEVTDRELLKRRLATLLSQVSLQLSAKAYSVKTDFEHVFIDARILTDVRPVFGASVDDAPPAAVVVGNLKIEYADRNGEYCSTHVALERSDLIELRAEIDRAVRKIRSVEKFLSKSSVRTLRQGAE